MKKRFLIRTVFRNRPANCSSRLLGPSRARPLTYHDEQSDAMEGKERDGGSKQTCKHSRSHQDSEASTPARVTHVSAINSKTKMLPRVGHVTSNGSIP